MRTAAQLLKSKPPKPGSRVLACRRCLDKARRPLSGQACARAIWSHRGQSNGKVKLDARATESMAVDRVVVIDSASVALTDVRGGRARESLAEQLSVDSSAPLKASLLAGHD